MGDRRTVTRIRTAIRARYVALDRGWKLRGAERQVFVDCGANTCGALRRFLAKLSDFGFFAFGPQPELQHEVHKVVREYPATKITFVGKAVWVKDETLSFFGHKLGSQLSGAAQLFYMAIPTTSVRLTMSIHSRLRRSTSAAG